MGALIKSRALGGYNRHESSLLISNLFMVSLISAYVSTREH